MASHRWNRLKMTTNCSLTDFEIEGRRNHWWTWKEKARKQQQQTSNNNNNNNNNKHKKQPPPHPHPPLEERSHDVRGNGNRLQNLERKREREREREKRLDFMHHKTVPFFDPCLGHAQTSPLKRHYEFLMLPFDSIALSPKKNKRETEKKRATSSSVQQGRQVDFARDRKLFI